jgi:hypothetical protein
MTDFNEQDIERLSAYLDGMLPEAERLELEALLRSADSPYQAELASLENTIKLVKGLPPLKAPRSFALTREMAGLPPIQVKRPVRAKQINFYAMSFLSAAASFIMVILAVVIWTSHTTQAPSTVHSVASAPTLALTQTQAQEIAPASGIVETIEIGEETPLITQSQTDDGRGSGVLLGSVVGRTDLPTIDPSEFDTNTEAIGTGSAEIFTSEPPAFMIPPIPFPEDSEEAPDVMMDMQPPTTFEETSAEDQASDAETGLFRSMRPSDEEGIDAIVAAVPPVEDSTFATAEEAEQLLEEVTPINESTTILEDSEIVVEELKTSTTDEQSESGLPAMAVVFLILGGIFALMTVTGIYWARKISA